MKIQKLRALSIGFFLAGVLGLVAGHQLLGTSRDYDNYLLYFSFVDSSSLAEVFAYRFEPGFGILAYFLSRFEISQASIYAIISGICIFIKLLGIGRQNNYWTVLVIFMGFYLARYFVVFEITILRATVASSLAFYVFIRRQDAHLKITDVALLLIAASMHYSASVFILIYLYSPKSRMGIFALTTAIFIMVALLKDLALSRLPDVLFVFSTYENLTGASALPKPMVIDALYLGLLFHFWRYCDFQMKIAVFGIMASFALHFALLEYSIYASRFRLILSMFFLVLVVRSFHHRRYELRFVAAIFVVVSSAMHLYGVFIYDTLLT